MQKALPLLVDGGVVLMTGSMADSKGYPLFGVYNATKAFIRFYARTWAAELQQTSSHELLELRTTDV